MSRLRILISNDDGIHAPGIQVLAAELSKFADVTVVAPTSERSGQSHAITIYQPLRLHEFGEQRYGVDGTPADCVMLALQHLYETPPDWVVSGINRGGNLGTDILYSGTVGAALEAANAGVKALAVSLEGIEGEPKNYEAAAKCASEVVQRPDVFGVGRYELLNLNVPDFPFEKILGLRTASVGRRIYEGKMWERHDPRGKPYYWIGAGGYGHEAIEGSDCVVLYEGYATISVLKADFFADQSTKDLQDRMKNLSNLSQAFQ